MTKPGTLYIVATPIGNLQDMSLRAIEVLKAVDWIAAEDTRHSLSLLNQFTIHTKTLSLHEHNERERANELLERLQQGESIALISDAGTPLISDPGYFLVREARELGIHVIPIPGPCAAITALCAAGLPTDRFVFEGFLPVKSAQRQAKLSQLLHEPRTMIFYEAPRRILDSLKDIQLIFGNERQVVIARELTKTFETIHQGVVSELMDWVLQDNNRLRGEMVLLLAGAPYELVDQDILMENTLKILLAELPLKQAVDLTAKITQVNKNKVYDLALNYKKQAESK